MHYMIQIRELRMSETEWEWTNEHLNRVRVRQRKSFHSGRFSRSRCVTTVQVICQNRLEHMGMCSWHIGLLFREYGALRCWKHRGLRFCGRWSDAAGIMHTSDAAGSHVRRWWQHTCDDDGCDWRRCWEPRPTMKVGHGWGFWGPTSDAAGSTRSIGRINEIFG